MIRMLGREEISELTTYKKKKKGFAAIVALISFASLVLPCVALGGFDRNNMAVFGGSSFAGFHRRGLFGEDESVGVEATVKQSSLPPTAEPENPAKTRRYVQPQWVDGGYGVEILEPDTGPARKMRQDVDYLPHRAEP